MTNEMQQIPSGLDGLLYHCRQGGIDGIVWLYSLETAVVWASCH